MGQKSLEGNWNVLKGKAKEQWGKLTDNDLTQIAGKRDQLVGRIQKIYAKSQEDAEREVTEWERTCSR